MGSGTRRKKSDLVIITPKKRKLNRGGLSSGSTRGGESQNSIEACPTSLKVGISQDVNLPDRTNLTIRKEKEGIALYFGGSILVKLTSKKGQLIAFCITKGLRYEASIMREGDSVYAKINQKS